MLVGSLITIGASSQPYWSQVVRSTGIDHVSDLVVDGTGATYMTGEFSATAVYWGQSFFALGGTDFFVAKVDADGALLWWQRGGGKLGSCGGGGGRPRGRRGGRAGQVWAGDVSPGGVVGEVEGPRRNPYAVTLLCAGPTPARRTVTA